MTTTSAPQTPQYTHDCGDCRFLGRYHWATAKEDGWSGRRLDYDLYIHWDGHKRHLLVARYGPVAGAEMSAFADSIRAGGYESEHPFAVAHQYHLAARTPASPAPE